jgi:hypothetical protein
LTAGSGADPNFTTRGYIGVGGNLDTAATAVTDGWWRLATTPPPNRHELTVASVPRNPTLLGPDRTVPSGLSDPAHHVSPDQITGITVVRTRPFVSDSSWKLPIWTSLVAVEVSQGNRMARFVPRSARYLWTTLRASLALFVAGVYSS